MRDESDEPSDDPAHPAAQRPDADRHRQRRCHGGFRPRARDDSCHPDALDRDERNGEQATGDDGDDGTVTRAGRDRVESAHKQRRQCEHRRQCVADEINKIESEVDSDLDTEEEARRRHWCPRADRPRGRHQERGHGKGHEHRVEIDRARLGNLRVVCEAIVDPLQEVDYHQRRRHRAHAGTPEPATAALGRDGEEDAAVGEPGTQQKLHVRPAPHQHVGAVHPVEPCVHRHRGHHHESASERECEAERQSEPQWRQDWTAEAAGPQARCDGDAAKRRRIDRHSAAVHQEMR